MLIALLGMCVSEIKPIVLVGSKFAVFGLVIVWMLVILWLPPRGRWLRC
jgi:hypothetical protein